MNKYINITRENIDSEHLCCAISDPKHKIGVDAKKKWLLQQLEVGHVFRKLDANGKVFIEYSPLETAWTPIDGDGFLYIYCLWVAGSYKGKGYAKELLEYAIADAKKQDKNGLCVISSVKKKPFLSEKKFFEKFGFTMVDSIGEYELLALCFNNNKPAFTPKSKSIEISSKVPTIFYTDECPFTRNSILEIGDYSKESGVKIDLIKVDTLQKAKDMPCVFNNWATFIDGKFVSNTLLNKNSLIKLLEK